jgi:hypothetical protein
MLWEEHNGGTSVIALAVVSRGWCLLKAAEEKGTSMLDP